MTKHLAPFYVVTYSGMFRDALGVCRRSAGTYERDFDDCGRAQTVRMIIEGQFDDIDAVLYVDPTVGTCDDVTEETAREVKAALDLDHGAGCPEHLIDWMDEQLGASTADKMNYSAGQLDRVYQPEVV